MERNDQSLHPQEKKVRIQVRVIPITYVMTINSAAWDAMEDEERAAIVYDDAEGKFGTEYEVLP